MLLNIPVNGIQTAVVGGSKTTGDTITVTVYDAALTGGSKANTYTVLAGDTLSSIASGIASMLNSDSSLAAIGATASAVSTVVNISSSSINATTYAKATSVGATETLTLAPAAAATQYGYNNINELTSIAAGGATQFQALTNKALKSATVNSLPAYLNWTENFSGNANLSSGGNTVPVNATDGAGNVKTNSYQIAVTGPANATTMFDTNGNMTSDGINSYTWDTENRLIKITYPGAGNYSQFTYDCLGGLIKIVEFVGGTATSTKLFVQSGGHVREERDSSGALTKQFFVKGQTIGGANFFYTQDQISSIRELTDTSANIQGVYLYDNFGQIIQKIGSIDSDFQYAGYYNLTKSSLSLTKNRAYHPRFGRWLSRDPIEETGGTNLYCYVGNSPVLYADPSGLKGTLTICATPGSFFCGCTPGHVWLQWEEAKDSKTHVLEDTTYGTWEGEGFQTGKEGRYTSELHGHCRSVLVSDKKEAELKNYFDETKALGAKAWSLGHTCVQFANTGWLKAGGPDLKINSIDDPADAEKWIGGPGSIEF